MPVWLTVTGEEIHAAIEGVIQGFLRTVQNAIEELPPEVAADLLEAGIMLTGGGAQLPGLPERLGRVAGLEVKTADSPTLTAVLGAGQMLRPAAHVPVLKPVTGQTTLETTAD